jgi:hypothetical protein
MTSTDLEYGIFSVFLIGCFFTIAIWRFPAANFVIGYTVQGLGSVAIFRGFTYAQIVVGAQLAALLILGGKLVGKQQKLRNPFRLTHSSVGMAAVLSIVWIKVLMECGYGGLDYFRLLALKTSIFSIAFPIALLFLSLKINGVEATKRQIIIGLMVVPIAYLMPLTKAVLADGRITESFFGSERLTVFGQDTISSGRIFFLGTLGYLFAAILPRQTARKRILLGLFSVSFLILTILNGTRQYLVAIAVAYIVTFLAVERASLLKKVFFSGALSAFFLVVFMQFKQTQASYRIQGEAIREDGRLHLWREKLSLLLESPVLGIGFRNGGIEYTVVLPDNSTVVDKDTVHGLIQEIFVEHGIVLGFSMLLFTIWFMRAIFRNRLSHSNYWLFLMGGFACSLMAAELFSSAIYNALGFHLAAVASMCLYNPPKVRTSFLN